MYKRETLESGLRIVTHEMPHRDSIALGIWVCAGGRWEEERISGISHLIEHLLFKGTKKRSGKKIKESIEGIGGSLNGFTTEEFTCYLSKVPKRYLSLCLDVLCDMVLNAKLQPQDLEREKQVIIEEIKLYRDLPTHLVGELLNQLLWPNHPLGMNLAGIPESVNSISREDILKYRSRFYTLSNLILAAAGSGDMEDILRESKRYFKQTQQGRKIAFKKAEYKQGRPKAQFHCKATEQTHISLGLHALSREHPDRHVLSLLHIILGANMSSRLFQEVREKRGLAYEVGTHIRRFKDTGALIVNAGIDNKKVPKAIEVILKELRRIRHQAVQQEELKRAKEFFCGQLLLALEETLEHMLWIGESQATLNRTYTPQQVLEEVNKVKVEDLRRVAGRIFKSNNLNLALVGPIEERNRKDIEEMLGILG